ncbi:hypothetical protein L6452_33672 [Arctium lappa]|uniref:Uncharacterized protein n=1 Tax=Arctium lappa TaxID=4217 RepID=A0ACB8YG89_ARCLA|nr:hypothetical protein L6452_33672 [Arctium lappa]
MCCLDFWLEEFIGGYKYEKYPPIFFTHFSHGSNFVRQIVVHLNHINTQQKYKTPLSIKSHFFSLYFRPISRIFEP